MAKLNPISFEEALENSTNKNRSILLGNGFSISLCENFDYKYLYKQAQKLADEGEISISKSIKNLFDDINTCDFEKVLDHLNITIETIKHYPKAELLNRTLNKDKDNLIAAFYNTINSVHPKFQSDISPGTFIACLKILSNFNKIFTTNYDLLLYWIIMNRTNQHLDLFNLHDFDFSSLPHDDGFTRDMNTNDFPKWNNNLSRGPQDVFYLHGSLFIINAIENFIKINNDSKDGRILEQIDKWLKDDQQPLIVLEGNYKDKAKKIYRHSYLRCCLNALSTLKGDLFLIGFSINDETDKHIIESIQESVIERV
ncbi:TPA: DUF4917 family protein, partial [Legionella pneumophila]|nr:DUF4917 family protein [Legionella pneumophila]HDO7909555.1 DUF4917 family protein [Legionella pneumophila]HDO9928351.1 DUF4917 family protein [Legionella pneumophila]